MYCWGGKRVYRRLWAVQEGQGSLLRDSEALAENWLVSGSWQWRWAFQAELVACAKGLWEGVWKLWGAESQVVGLEQRELESGERERPRERPREEGPCQVIQALSSTFQGPYSMSLRSQRRLLWVWQPKAECWPNWIWVSKPVWKLLVQKEERAANWGGRNSNQQININNVFISELLLCPTLSPKLTI